MKSRIAWIAALCLSLFALPALLMCAPQAFAHQPAPAGDARSIAPAQVTQVAPGVYVRPFGKTLGFTDDHLHLDFGYVVMVPRSAPLDAFNPKIEVEPR